ncbi:hypothetical protein OB2597_06270 [Pseudooceanicola batsensis HTCC2597]|uniref:Uncharacterized protein n=2 Tax=Pseudooceanicola batsensis TaxID=314255 RepID=A3TT89_PSEBH|nr:hypothetical protein OB2597_06270 [Pseudooceanicola batsensis HTCC2597]
MVSLRAPARLLAFALALSLPSSAQATTVTSGQLKLALAGGEEVLIDLALELLLEGINGSRGAAAIAVVKSYGDSDAAGCPGWGCDTGEVTANAADADGSAEARARSNPPLGAFRGVRAKASGKVASSRAAITWKGKVKAEAEGNLPARLNGALPDAADVNQAVATLNYVMPELDILAESQRGSFALTHDWNGLRTFDGGLHFDETAPLPVFSDDLLGYESAFTNSAGSISSSALMVTQSVSFAIDYASFLADQSFVADFEGEAEARASVVPLPAGILLLSGALITLGIGRRRPSGRKA